MKVFKLEQGRVAYLADFAAYALGIVLTGIALLAIEPPDRWWQLALLCVAGLACWTLIEYLLHRFVLHGLQPFARWHAVHHQRPTALVCTPTVLSAGLILLLFSLPAILMFGWDDAGALTLGLTIGYFGYAVVHHALHHWRLESAWLHRRKVSHAMHHHGPSAVCFGVSTGLWDSVFGTSRRRPSQPGAASAPPAGSCDSGVQP